MNNHSETSYITPCSVIEHNSFHILVFLQHSRSIISLSCLRSMEIFPQILLTGASGLIGSALALGFTSQSIPFTSLVRRAAPPGSSSIVWNPYEFEFREEMRRLSGIRAVIHLAGENVSDGRWTKEKKQRIRSSRVKTTQSLVQLLFRLEQRPEVLLSASATGFYGHRGAEILTEVSPPGEGFLAEVCREWEAEAEKATELGIRVVNLRFGVVLTPAGGALAKMLPIFRMGMGGRLGNGEQWMSWISLPEIPRVVDFCIGNPKIQGPVNVVANPVRNQEFTEMLGRHLHRPALLPAPAFVLRLAVGKMADAALLASTRAVPEKLLKNGFIFQHPTLPEALQHMLPV